jgi:hypothetical protein
MNRSGISSYNTVLCSIWAFNIHTEMIQEQGSCMVHLYTGQERAKFRIFTTLLIYGNRTRMEFRFLGRIAWSFYGIG